VYRDLFRCALDAEAVADIRRAVNQSQPLGNSRFYATISRTTGVRREPKPRGRPTTVRRSEDVRIEDQAELGL
jgi:putative transposase